jgi:PTH1 family peptidyl-tRNA hydrolase
LIADGTVRGQDVRVIKPVTYMNRSGAALVPLRSDAFDPTTDLLVVVDDAALEVGRVRFRSRGSPGGHNGLKSVEAVLGTQDYARLRIGVGIRPPEVDLADWVLSPVPEADEEVILGLLPQVTRAVEGWLEDGSDTGMSRFNR